MCLSVCHVCVSLTSDSSNDLDARSQWVDKDIQISVACSRQPGNKLATTVVNVSLNLELDFANVYIDYAFCSSSFGFRPRFLSGSTCIQTWNACSSQWLLMYVINVQQLIENSSPLHVIKQ